MVICLCKRHILQVVWVYRVLVLKMTRKFVVGSFFVENNKAYFLTPPICNILLSEGLCLPRFCTSQCRGGGGITGLSSITIQVSNSSWTGISTHCYDTTACIQILSQRCRLTKEVAVSEYLTHNSSPFCQC